MQAKADTQSLELAPLRVRLLQRNAAGEFVPLSDVRVSLSVETGQKNAVTSLLTDSDGSVLFSRKVLKAKNGVPLSPSVKISVFPAEKPDLEHCKFPQEGFINMWDLDDPSSTSCNQIFKGVSAIRGLSKRGEVRCGLEGFRYPFYPEYGAASFESGLNAWMAFCALTDTLLLN
jgi:hypothetical protein